MHVAVPFDAANPKSRLARVLDAEERAGFARAALADVLAALAAAGVEPTVYATRELDLEAVARAGADAWGDREGVDAVGPVGGSAVDRPGGSTVGRPGGSRVDAVDAELVVDDRGLDALVDALVDDATGDEPVAVAMADLGLATPAALSRLFEVDGDVVLAPGRGGGTNALVVRAPGFAPDFHGVSLRDHREIAREAGLDVAEVDSMRLATDVDEPADLVEVLLHGRGRAAAWLRERGFEVVVEEGRASVARRDGG